MRDFPFVTAVLAAGLLSASPALAEPGPTPAPSGSYFFRAEQKTSLVYLRLPDEPRTGATVRAWKMIYLRTPQMQTGFGLVRYGAVLDEFDCETPRSRTVAVAAFGEDDALAASDGAVGEWSQITSGSNADYDRALACTGKPLPDDNPGEPLIGRAAWRADAAARIDKP